MVKILGNSNCIECFKHEWFQPRVLEKWKGQKIELINTIVVFSLAHNLASSSFYDTSFQGKKKFLPLSMYLFQNEMANWTSSFLQIQKKTRFGRWLFDAKKFPTVHIFAATNETYALALAW